MPNVRAGSHIPVLDQSNQRSLDASVQQSCTAMDARTVQPLVTQRFKKKGQRERWRVIAIVRSYITAATAAMCQL